MKRPHICSFEGLEVNGRELEGILRWTMIALCLISPAFWFSLILSMILPEADDGGEL